MKTVTPPLFQYRFSRGFIRKRNFLRAVLLTSILGCASLPAFASNILVNPSFENDNTSARIVPTGWTYYAPPGSPNPGDYWIEHNVTPHSGFYFWKQWNAIYNHVNNVAGIYQDFSSAPGSTYQASGWFYACSCDLLSPESKIWVEVSFLGAGNQLLALYKSDDFSSTVGTDEWLQYQVTGSCDLSQPVPTGDPNFTTYAVTGTVSQVVAPPGTTTVRYRFAYLSAGTFGGSCYFDDAVLDQLTGPQPPVISNLFPLNMIFVNPGDGISFTVTSPGGLTINNSGIHLVVNGNDVSNSLVISGTPSSKNVSYHGLQSNLTYNASITVMDTFNLTANASTYFETTWVGIPPIVYLWEAEDFDFTNGMYINFPQLCAVPDNPNCYFGKVGTPEVDEHNASNGPYHQYRPDDLMGTTSSGDFARKDHYVAGVTDYRIDPFNGDEWLNYTRDWTNGTYWVIGRLSTDINLSGSLTLSWVNSDGSTTDIGTFTITSGLGWSTFENVFLKDSGGNIANVTFNGHATLRVTSGGNLLPNFFAIVAGVVDLPRLNNLYPTGTQPFEFTNTLSFNVSSSGATIAPSAIQVILDGNNVSSVLQIGGTASARTVVYPNLQPNALHTAVITVTNSLGHGIAVANSFDTFTQDNYMVEAEDFDYDGGQYVTPWSPEAYSGLGATTNIDFQHTYLNGQAYTYRTDGIPEDLTQDFKRQVFLDAGARDYDLTWFAPGDWANYTRQYPAGSFYVYGRFSGLGNYTMYLDQVVSGAGTTSQTTKRLGTWGTAGRAYNLYDWVRLTDDGLQAPTVVKLNGLATLRITTTGSSNPNYFMLVPTSTINLTATRSGGNIVLSFPTQAGGSYRVFYRTDLTSGNWNMLTTVLGDGSVKSVNDAASGSVRYYKVVAP